MKKKPTLRSLKNKCWRVFSEWIRRRDADAGGTERCWTCGTLAHWKEMHAGHGIPGRHNAVLLDEDIVKPQCVGCNIFRNGCYHIFTTKLIQEHGMEWWEKKLFNSRQIVKMTRDDYEILIKTYQAKLHALDLVNA